MAVPWLALLTKVPWQEVIRNAPKVVAGAQKLWTAVEKRTAPSAAPDEPEAGTGMTADAALEAKVRELEASVSGLHEQMLASSELINSLAEQNAQLIRRVVTLRTRMFWLAGALAAVGALLAFVVLRGY